MFGEKQIKRHVKKPQKPADLTKIITNVDRLVRVPDNTMSTATVYELLAWVESTQRRQGRLLNLVKPQIQADVDGYICSVLRVSAAYFAVQRVIIVQVGHSHQPTWTMQQVHDFFETEANHYDAAPVMVQLGENLVFPIVGHRIVSGHNIPDLFSGLLPFRNKLCLNLAATGEFIEQCRSGQRRVIGREFE